MSAIDVPSARVRPSGWWYVLVPLAFVLGIAGAISNGIDEFGNIGDRFARLGSDGKSAIELREGEHASVWLLDETGASPESMNMRAVTIQVRAPGGEQVAFEPASSRSTIEFGSLSGIRVGDFEATGPGDYEVTSQPVAAPGSQDVAVGNLDVGLAVWNTFRPIVIGTLAGIGLLILLLVARGRSKRRIARSGHDGSVLLAPNVTSAPTTGAPTTTSSSQGPISFE